MKFRKWFVNKGPIISFCLFGVCKSSEEWKDILNAINSKNSEQDIDRRLDFLLKDSFLYYAHGVNRYSKDDIIIGSQPKSHKDKFKDKTFSEYEDIVLAEFKKFFGDNEYSLVFYTDGGYRG